MHFKCVYSKNGKAFSLTWVFCAAKCQTLSLWCCKLPKGCGPITWPRDASTHRNPLRLNPFPTARTQVPWQQNYWLPTLSKRTCTISHEQRLPYLLFIVCFCRTNELLSFRFQFSLRFMEIETDLHLKIKKNQNVTTLIKKKIESNYSASCILLYFPAVICILQAACRGRCRLD